MTGERSPTGADGDPGERPLEELVQEGRRAPALPARLGGHDVLVETARLGRGVGTSVYQLRGERVLTFRAMYDSYREDVATALLDAVDGIADADGLGPAVHLRPIDVPGFPLDRAALLGPGATDFFRRRPELAERGLEVVPVHHSEVADGEDGDAFWFALSNRGIGVDRSDWARAPRPRAQMRLLDAWPGGPYRSTKHLFPVAAQRVMEGEVPRLPSGVRLLMRDVRGHELELRREWDRISARLCAPDASGAGEITIPRHRAWEVLAPLFQGEDIASTALTGVGTATPAEPDLLEMTYSSHDRGYAALKVPETLHDCLARLRRLTPHTGDFATFTGRSGDTVQVIWEDGPRLWLEGLDPAGRRSYGGHVTVEEAEQMITTLAREDRIAPPHS